MKIYLLYLIFIKLKFAYINKNTIMSLSCATNTDIKIMLLVHTSIANIIRKIILLVQTSIAHKKREIIFMEVCRYPLGNFF